MSTRTERKERNSRPVSTEEAIVFKFILDAVKESKRENPSLSGEEMESLIRKVSRDYGVDEERMKGMFIWEPTPPSERW